MDINRFQKARKSRQKLDTQELKLKLQSGDRGALSRAITLVESSRPDDRKSAQELLQSLEQRTEPTWRIGITGMPGAGKSTFINSFGSFLISQGHRVAVLAVDPSSAISGGSILGDKTRMPELAVSDKAFIRPSPSGNTLGGVAARTREAILLCEAADFDVILVETVGVGQSETHVRSMVDHFLLLSISGAGDELQGVKRGIMEMLDSLLVNKADGDNTDKARKDASSLRSALHLLPGRPHHQEAYVHAVSAMEKTGFEEYLDYLKQFFKNLQNNGFIQKNRESQLTDWIDNEMERAALERIRQSDLGSQLENIHSRVQNGELQPLEAFALVDEILKSGIK